MGQTETVASLRILLLGFKPLEKLNSWMMTLQSCFIELQLWRGLFENLELKDATLTGNKSAAVEFLLFIGSAKHAIFNNAIFEISLTSRPTQGVFKNHRGQLMKNGPAKQFEGALSKNELHHFLAGDTPYFVEAKTDNEEPQNVEQAFDLQICPYIIRTQDTNLPDALADGLIKMLTTHADPARATYLAYSWVWYLLYCEAKKRGDPTGYYKDLPLFDFSDVALTAQRKADLLAATLKQDTRWAGAAWNSQMGLWEPICNLALAIRDRLGGPDMVPTSA
jgi:hypothetical protein